MLNGLVVGVFGTRMSSTRANMITKGKLLATTLPSADILRPAPATAALPIPAGAAASTEAHLRMSGATKQGRLRGRQVLLQLFISDSLHLNDTFFRDDDLFVFHERHKGLRMRCGRAVGVSPSVVSGEDILQLHWY